MTNKQKLNREIRALNKAHVSKSFYCLAEQMPLTWENDRCEIQCERCKKVAIKQ